MLSFEYAFKELPLIAILRGIGPNDCAAVGEALVEAGFRIIEVPLNSPEPLRSISILAQRLEGRAIVGAGTVLSEAEVHAVADAGGRIIVSPNCNLEVIGATRRLGLASAPGVATPSEGFAALAAGADVLKLFPGEMLTPPVVKALRAVLPASARLVPVGGVSVGNMADYVSAGASGFGIGSMLYKPGDEADIVAHRARALVEKWRQIIAERVPN